MAKNWTMKEATKEVLAGSKEAIMDMGRRFPLTLAAIIKTNGNEGALEIINALPEHITARKIESVLKDGVQEIEDDEVVEETTEETVEEKPAKKAPAKKAKKEETVEEEKEEDEVDYSKMNAVELFKLCKKRGIKVEPKQKAAVYVKALQEADKPVEDDWDEDEAEEEKPVKKAPAKKAEKKPAKKAVEEDDEDDWDI